MYKDVFLGYTNYFGKEAKVFRREYPDGSREFFLVLSDGQIVKPLIGKY